MEITGEIARLQVVGVSPGLMGFVLVFSLLYIAGFVWAWRNHHFEHLEFTKYKVFNDAGPDEPHPSPWNRRERELNPIWIPVVLGLMILWVLLMVAIVIGVVLWG
jgi:fatty acid desaturase